jgi:hypothetical protein
MTKPSPLPVRDVDTMIKRIAARITCPRVFDYGEAEHRQNLIQLRRQLDWMLGPQQAQQDELIAA